MMGLGTSEDTAMEADPGARVLVAIMNNRRDWEIVRAAGWYRVPLKRASGPVEADYLAFYQTRTFGRERWAVTYYAKVRSCQIVKRRDLFPDEPWHPRAEDDYYRFDLEPLQRLEHPVVSQRLRRVTFIVTTLGKLLSAREINDLF
jgi:hypothetical protein